jgi:hypothetical protein
MMKLKTVFFLVAAAVMAFTLPPADVKLQYHFKAGDQYNWSQDTKQKLKQSVAGMEQESENLYQGDYVLKVVEVKDGVAKLEASFTRLKTSSKSLMGENNMDSEGPSDKMENKIFQSMLNKPFFIYLSNSGAVEKIEGAQNLWSGFEALEVDAARKKLIRETLQMMLGEEALKSSFQSSFIPYPDKKVGQGDKWTSSQDVVMNFVMSIESNWNVVSIASGVADVSGEGVYKTTDKEKILNLPGGMKAKSDLGGRQAVKTKVDVKTGWPSKQEILVELKGTMLLLAGGMIPQDMEIPTEIVSETTYLVTKK